MERTVFRLGAGFMALLFYVLAPSSARADRISEPQLFELIAKHSLDVTGTISTATDGKLIIVPDDGSAPKLVPEGKSRSDLRVSVGSYGRLVVGPSASAYDAVFIDSKRASATLSALTKFDHAKSPTKKVDALLAVMASQNWDDQAARKIYTSYFSSISRRHRATLAKMAAGKAGSSAAWLLARLPKRP